MSKSVLYNVKISSKMYSQIIARSLKKAQFAPNHFIIKFLTRRNIHSTSAYKKTFQPEPTEQMYLEPKCKVALITGAEGIGFACANHLLKNGARGVVILGVDPVKGKESALALNNSYGRNRAIFLNSNINCLVQFEEAFRETKREYGNIDIMINAAGILDGHQWEREVVTNLIGTIRGTLLGYKYIGVCEGRGRGGVIINISGITGLEPLATAPTLSAEHHAIIGLTRSFGSDLQTLRTKVRVACLCPGFTTTAFISRAKDKAMCDEYGRELENQIAKARKQRPDAIGMAAIHLIRHASSGSIWVVEGSQLYRTDIPPRSSYMKLEAQYT